MAEFYGSSGRFMEKEVIVELVAGGQFRGDVSGWTEEGITLADAPLIPWPEVKSVLKVTGFKADLRRGAG